VADLRIDRSSATDVRAIQRRRDLDDIAFALSLESAQRGLAWTARDDQEIVGIAIARDADDERSIGDLYVEPSYRDQGIGTALLETALAESDLTRATLLDGRDLGALALALRFRMAPRESILRFAGAIPREEELAKMAAGDYRFEVAAIDATTHGFVLNELDRRARGTPRSTDHSEFARAATGHVFFLSGECVGYGYVWPDGRVGPLACASEAYLVQIFAYALVTLSRGYGASWCTALVPGSNRRIARAALRAGLRIEQTLLFAADSLAGDFSTYLGHHRLLF
jgi:GNAT superfamily N-acetyltransferase